MFIITAALYLLFLAKMSLTQTAVNDPGAKPKITSVNELSGKQLTGAWKFNRADSDNALEQIRHLYPSAENESEINDDQAELSALAVLLFPCESMSLAGDETRITITEKFKDLTQSRSFIPDGKRRSKKQASGLDFAVTAVLKTGFLTIETTSPRGFRLIETYELLPDAAGKLKGQVRLTDAAGKEMVALRRGYDRMVLDLFLGDEKEIQ